MNRTRDQFLEMIARTRASDFAVQALENELHRADLNDTKLTNTDRLEVEHALENLRAQIVLEVVPKSDTLALSTRPQASIEYRPHGDANKGRLYLEIEGREQVQTIEHDGLDALEIYVFSDAKGFAGLQVDNAKTLPERLANALELLRTSDLPNVDCNEAGLENATVADVLAWSCTHRIAIGR
jgi:hypothetical protein